MARKLEVVIELGPKRKRQVALAPAWPGFARGAKTEGDAVERLQSYLPRYAPIAKLAGLDAEFTDISGAEVVERYPGTGSTDFWGISFAFSSIDHQPMTADGLERQLRLMRACWTFFDQTRARVSAEMQRGPRGGGRDRDRIVSHVLLNEIDWAPKLGLRPTAESIATEEGLRAHRDAYCDDIRTFHAEGKMAGRWPLRYLVRHTAFHTLDHAWEMEDKDLGVSA